MLDIVIGYIDIHHCRYIYSIIGSINNNQNE